VTLTPPSSIGGSAVSIIGTVSADITDRAARLLGHVTAEQGTSPWVVDGSAVTQPVSVTGQPIATTISGTVPVSVDALPLPNGAATEETLATAAEALNDVGLTAILQRERMAAE
jgi:hypothetical protein